MTAAIYRSTPSLSVPQTQNTAPVLEFACLYTHDLRKKAKKWHDGILRYHTFNKRAMVYDVPRNFIGDMHWTEEEDMQEGDEALLEKAGVKVEVAERIGQTETDLSELRARKGPETNPQPQRRVDRTDVRAATPIVRASSGSVARGNTQLKHKSLNALLGTPKGHMGKATLPTKSPFEERHSNVENEHWEDGRPAKKARRAEARTPKKAVKPADDPLWARTADRKAQQQGQQPADQVFIDLSDDVTPSNAFPPGFSSDALAPSSPVRAVTRDLPRRSSSPTFQSRQPADVPQRAAVKNKTLPRISDLDQERENEAGVIAQRVSKPPDKPPESPQPAKQMSPEPLRPSSTRPGQTLRLAASAPKKRTSLCQDQLTKKTPRKPAMGLEHNNEEGLDTADNNDRPRTAKDRIQERLDQISKRKARSKTFAAINSNTTNASISAIVDIGDGYQNAPGKSSVTKSILRPRPEKNPPKHNDPVASCEAGVSSNRAASENFGQRSSHEVSAIELARLDQMMLPPAAPRRAPTPPVPALSPRQARPLRRVISEPLNRPVPKASAGLAKPGQKRVPGAPVRYTTTPSPTKRSRDPAPVSPAEKESRAPFKNKPNKTLQKSVSLNITAAGTSTVILGRPFQAPGKPQTAKPKKLDPPPEDVGPWSREAFDLFKWRPPGWDEEKWCIAEATEAGR